MSLMHLRPNPANAAANVKAPAVTVAHAPSAVVKTAVPARLVLPVPKAREIALHAQIVLKVIVHLVVNGPKEVTAQSAVASAPAVVNGPPVSVMLAMPSHAKTLQHSHLRLRLPCRKVHTQKRFKFLASVMPFWQPFVRLDTKSLLRSRNVQFPSCWKAKMWSVLPRPEQVKPQLFLYLP